MIECIDHYNQPLNDQKVLQTFIMPSNDFVAGEIHAFSSDDDYRHFDTTDSFSSTYHVI